MKKLIKLFTGLGALIILLIGIALLGLTVYGYINSSIFLGDNSTKNLVLGVMMGVSLAIVGGAAEGIYGICTQKSKLVCLFQIIVILFMIIFFAVGVGLVILPGQFFNGSCSSSSNAVIQYANNIYTVSQRDYCISINCPCALDMSDANLMSKYTTTQIDFIKKNYNSTNSSAAHSTQACLQQATSLTPPQLALFEVIKQLENLLDCSNWCDNSTNPNGNLIYRFNDINSGKPVNYCYTKLQQTFRDYDYYGKIGFFSGGGILLLMFVCNMYICCCSSQRKHKDYRQRFMYMDNQLDDQPPRYKKQRY